MQKGALTRIAREHGGLFSVALLASTMLGGAEAAPAMAQETQASSAHAYDIPAQSLERALVAFGRQSRIQVAAEADLVAGRQSNAVSGSLAAGEALSRLLAGTGLTFRFVGPGAVRIERAPQASGGAVHLGPVRVEGASSSTGTIASSRNASMTENTGSYTASAVAAGSKLEQPLKDVPRSISVLSRQQLDDQRFVQFNEAMEQLGVVLGPNQGGWGNEGYSTRSYALTGVTVDGSTVKNFFFGGDSSLNTGLAKFDSVQLVRGPEGLFTGNGTPGGSINLVRKRPLDSFQLKVAASAGSWSNYLGLVDISAPLNGSGSLRARAVASYNDTEKFYRNAHRKYTTLYGIVEADLGEQTMLSGGISYDDVGGTGQDIAVDFPRYSTGDPLPLPRRLAYPNFSARNSESTNVFARLEHQFNSQWKGKLNLSYTRANGLTSAISYDGWFGSPGVDPLTGKGTSVWAPRVNTWTSKAVAADFSIQGDTTIGGHEYKLIVGADYVRTNLHNSQIAATFTYPGVAAPTMILPVDWATFDPFQLVMIDGQRMEQNHEKQIQWGIYIYNSLQLYGPLRFIVGGRLSGYKQDNRNLNVPSGNVGVTHQKDEGIFIPYFALQLNISRQWTAYATLARGYEDQSNKYSEAHEPLGPVRSRSLELGIKGELWDGRLNAQITAYRTRRNNVSVSLFNDYDFNNTHPGKTCCFAGDSRFKGQGVEVDVNGELLKGLQVNFGYTLDDSKINYGPSQGLRMSTNVPRHIFRAWVRYDLPDGLGVLSNLAIGGGGTMRSSFYAQGNVRIWNPSGGADGAGGFDGPMVAYKFREPGRALVNLFAEYKVNPQWSLALNVNNVFDKKYFEFVGTTAAGNAFGAPRNFLVTLRGTY